MVRSIQQLEALREGWTALAARFESPLLDHDWFLSCAEAFHRDADLRIVTVRRGPLLEAVAPMVRDDRLGGRHVILLGASRLFEPSGWLYADTQALRQLAAESMTLGEPLVLQRVPADSPMVAALRSLPRAVSVARGTSTALGVDVRTTWDAYYSSLSSRITDNLRRLGRKAERALGPRRVVCTRPAPADVDGLLEQVVKVEGSGWKARAASSLSRRTDLRDFFRRYSHRAAAAGRLRIATLSFGSVVAAVELSVEAYQRLWQLKIGYSEALAAYYPGLQLTQASIHETFERGLRSYEFLGSAARWEERWEPSVRTYCTLASYPFGVRSLLTGCRDLASLMWSRAQTITRRPVPETA